MSEGDLALPIGHVPTGSPNPVVLEVCIGRPYRQPVSLPDANQFVSGIELWVPDEGNHGNLYAMFDGLLYFDQIPGPEPQAPLYKLELHLTPANQNEFGRIRGLFEPIAKVVIYKNVDRVRTREIIENLLRGAYNNALNTAPNQWHPTMREHWQGQRLKDWFDSVGEPGTPEFEAALGELLDSIFTVDLPTPLPQSSVSVQAGDLIGFASTAQPFDPLPSDCTFPLGPVTPRRVTIVTKEYAGNELNPSYYLWRYLWDAHLANPNRRRVEFISRASMRPDHTFDHPLLNELSIDLDVEVPARIRLAPPANTMPFPISESLREWHGAKPANTESTLQWRLTNDDSVEFETRIRPGVNQIIGGTTVATCGVNAQPNARSNACPEPSQADINRIGQIWNNHGEDIDAICSRLQFPVEIVTAIIRGESNGRARIVRLEPIRQQEIQQLQNSPLGNTPQGNIVIQNAINLLGVGRSGLIVPNNPFQNNNPILQGFQLTWAQLGQVIDNSPTYRASPGLTQTLIQMGQSRINWLRGFYNNVPDEFGVDPLPVNRRGWFEWLLSSRNSILAGTAHLKYAYCNFGTRFDPPRVSAAHNAGSIVDASTLRHSINDVRHNPWQMRCNANIDGSTHISNFTTYFNAVRNYQETSGNGEVVFTSGL
ncbi:hypothetical protein [Haladaptatus sp. DFWS20]|uniref:hypothetical protein n=1 Tax=Haladaptatus sp. DFWS20 TaxID=3403467 RepID=UPI003EBD9547